MSASTSRLRRPIVRLLQPAHRFGEDLEPAEPWDIAFFTYEDEVAPGTYYPVTGGLIHPNVAVQQRKLGDPFLDGSYSLIPSRLKPMPLATTGSPLCPVKATPSKRRCYFVADSYGDVWRGLHRFWRFCLGEITFGLIEAGTIANGVPRRQLNPFDSTPIRWHWGNR